MADYELPVTKPQGGTLEDSRPDGRGKPSENDPALPSRQPVNIPPGFPRRNRDKTRGGSGNATRRLGTGTVNDSMNPNQRRPFSHGDTFFGVIFPT
jgi:hypothetical protein